MIRTKFFRTSRTSWDIDLDINDFLQRNPEIEVVDIKLISLVTPSSGVTICALLIYKYKKDR